MIKYLNDYSAFTAEFLKASIDWTQDFNFDTYFSKMFKRCLVTWNDMKPQEMREFDID